MKLRNLLFIVLAAIVFCNCQSYQPTSLTVASYNLRNANGSDSARGDGWGQRYPVIAQIVQYHDFDIFGTQECFLHQHILSIGLSTLSSQNPIKNILS